MIPRTYPLAVNAGAGLVDGVLLDMDHKAGRTTNTKQWSTYWEALGVLAGFFGENLGLGRDTTEPLIFGSLYRLAGRAAAFYAPQVLPAQLMYQAPMALPAAAAMGSLGAAAQIVPFDARRQPSGILP